MNEIQTQTNPGLTLYSIIRNSSVQVWNGASFENYNSANWSIYASAVPLTQQGNTGFYSANFPVAITAPDTYSIEIFSGTGTLSDTFIAGGSLAWNGTAATSTTFGLQLTSLEMVKTITGITVTTYDSTLLMLINVASQAVQSYCNRQFILNTYAEYYDGPSSTELQLNQYPVISVSGVTLFAQNNFTSFIPGSSIVVNNDIGVISISPNSTYFNYFPYDGWAIQQNILVNYTAGYALIPNDIQFATAYTVRDLFNSIGEDARMKSENIQNSRYEYTKFDDGNHVISSTVRLLLSSYKEFTI